MISDVKMFMRMIPIKKGLFALLILEAGIISAVTVAFMVHLYHTYTNLVYNESAEILNLNAVITATKLSNIEDLSLEILSNQDIQSNLRKYIDFPNSYDTYTALSDLYTQLFTRWIMNKNIISVIFVFLDGKRVDAGRLRQANLAGPALQKIVAAAARANGSCGWAANVAGENTVTLYRLIKDISGRNKFRPLGTLIINVDGRYFLNHTPIVSKKYRPDIICVADGQMITQKPLQFPQDEFLKYLEQTTKYKIITINKRPLFVSIKKLAYDHWYLLYILSVKDLLSNIYHINIVYMALMLLIVISVTFFGYKFANAIGQPITQLTKAMKNVEENNYQTALTDFETNSNSRISEVRRLSFGFSKMVQKIDHLINEVYLKQLLIMEMKYKMLQQQINPHFLYNTLDTINWKAIQCKNKEISIMVRSLSKLLRGSIKGPDIITLREDLDFVEDYIRIQKIRFEERLEFSAEIPGTFYACLIPRLTLQPIVENCIIHNLEKYAGLCRISITSAITDGRLEIRIDDTGRGVDLQRMEMVLNGRVETGNNSIGLKNIDQRIKMAFGEDFGVTVENKEPTGTRVTVILPSERDQHANAVDCR